MLDYQHTLKTRITKFHELVNATESSVENFAMVQPKNIANN